MYAVVWYDAEGYQVHPVNHFNHAYNYMRKYYPDIHDWVLAQLHV